MVTRIGSPRPVQLFIREWREHKQLTQQQVADRVGTSKGQVSRWESSKRGISVDVQAAVSYALGVEPADLFRHPDTPSADALLRGASDHERAQAVALVEALLKARKAS